MDSGLRLVRAVDGAIRYLRTAPHRTNMNCDPWERERRRMPIARSLRLAVVDKMAQIKELDADLLEDLMKMIKKIGKDTAKGGNGFSTRLKLALELTQMTFNNNKMPTYQNEILDRFVFFYQGLEGIMQLEQASGMTM